jgi:succinate-semialdehyde dehydrogenase/glutarate-semialdehyde dehydrogenase
VRSINPATGEFVREYPDHDDPGVEGALRASARAAATWRDTPTSSRARRFRALASLLRGQGSLHARLMTLEMGKPITASEAEVDKCAWVCEYFADNAEAFLAPETIATDAARSFVRYDPLGVVLAVMPWNFPYWQVFRCAAPAMMAGNVIVLKHASNVPGCSLAIARSFAEAGFPEGAFTSLLVGSSRIRGLVEHPQVAAVSLTGSDTAGSAVAATAGGAIKKLVLELGGSDPFIVLADADPLATAEHAATSRAINSGQSCIAAKRFIVEESIANTFEDALTDRMSALKVGDPMDRNVQVGPLARGDLREELERQVVRSARMGAIIRTGGAIPAGGGYFYPPTVLTGVRPGMPAFDDETFGPVAAVVRARNADDAISLANRSRFGLGASVWTADVGRGEALAARIEAGCVFVNGIVRSDPRLPFGGIKRSGYGRELASVGIREFTNVKTVWLGG